MPKSAERVAANAQLARSLELRAIVSRSRGEFEDALDLAQLAVDFSSFNHPGWFVSPTLERELMAVGQSVVEPVIDVSRAGGEIVHLLNGPVDEVMVEAHRWWDDDPSARVLASSASTIRPVQAANDLRRELGTASLVVCHGSGSGIVPFLALAGWAERPPVVLVEGRRPAFWCGVAIGDVVVHMAVETMALAVKRRCIAASRAVVVEPGAVRSSESAAMLESFGEHARSLGSPRFADSGVAGSWICCRRKRVEAAGVQRRSDGGSGFTPPVATARASQGSMRLGGHRS